jgi:hypothetical protein
VAGAQPDEAAARTRSSRADKLWADARVDPIEIALPGGVGYTLRAYRSSAEVVRPTIAAPTDDESDDFDAASAAVARRRRGTTDEDEDEYDEELDESDVDELDDEDFDEEDLDEEDEEEEDEEDEEEDKEAEQEVPVFLGRAGKVFLFHSPDKLVEFVKSGAEHDLSQLDTWSTVVKRITGELDLLVENLRGGSDVWDAPLILRAGELARDLSFALRIDPVLVALSAGTPLDQLDEALRAAESGGLSGMLARRRLKKIPAQQSSLAWRTIIGKISAAVDWRD